MGRTIEYTIMGPPKIPGRDPSPLSKSLPYRQDSRGAPSNLRSLYRISAPSPAETEHKEHPTGLMSTIPPTSPHLPPTPPGASNGDVPHIVDENISEVAKLRSALVTPINQHSPPTPDNTPPREKDMPLLRPFLGTQPSITSTGAESFITACEDLDSAEDSEAYSQDHESESQRPLTSTTERDPAEYSLRHRCLPGSLLINSCEENDTLCHGSPDCLDHQSPTGTHKGNTLMVNENDTARFQSSAHSLSYASTSNGHPPYEVVSSCQDAAFDNIAVEDDVTARPGETAPSYSLRRDKSLRDKLLRAQMQDPSASTERFADIIGWNNSVPSVGNIPEKSDMAREECRRLSGVSATSTIGAFVVEQNPLPRRRTTLRHMNKHESLRSVSSPLPASNRNSMNSNSHSPRRLVHKNVRLSNQNRWSFGSEVSKSHSLASSAALPNTEIIRVAVIPERRSSLPSTHGGSHRQSLSNESAQSHSRSAADKPPSSWQHTRVFSESLGRGREAEPDHSIPARSASPSAPTSRTTSRANSVTSEHLRVRRQQAEKDLRRTLDRMESDRLVQNLRVWDLEEQALASNAPKTATSAGGSFGRVVNRSASPPVTLWSSPDHKGNLLGLAIPGTSEWAALRPPSILETPFSQPSFQSASPEISEAKAVNFFAHNNHSLQLIEPFSVSESKAVQEVYGKNLPSKEVESPLRHPRRPPQPPQFKVIPPSPGGQLDKEMALLESKASARIGSLRRRGNAHRRSESFLESISRNLSVTNARNRKANQELDGKLHPFWRPRAFWDDIDVGRPEIEQERPSDPELVNNSLGLPQERTVVTGPISLVRRMSERRWQKRGIVKQSSHGSLAKLRASRRLRKSHGLALRFPLIRIKDIQERLFRAKERREVEKLERRRAELRRSIGPNIISQGDSRFPASNTSLSRAV